MALAFTKVQGPTAIGHSFRTHYTIAADNSYPTGGWSCPVTSLGLGAAAANDPDLLVEVIDGTNGYQPKYDYTNQKLLMYTSAGTQTSNATDLSALTAIRVCAWSKFRG